MAKACSLPGRLFAFEHRVQKLSIQPIHRMIRQLSRFEYQVMHSNFKITTLGLNRKMKFNLLHTFYKKYEG